MSYYMVLDAKGRLIGNMQSVGSNRYEILKRARAIFGWCRIKEEM